MQRIFYFCPDFPQPSGGIKTLYRHVYRLRQLGFAAALVHQKQGFTLDWHGFDVPVLWLEERPQFSRADLLVFPEVMTDFIRQTQHFDGTRVVIALSWLPSYSRLQPGERWQDLGITHVLTKSPVIARLLEWSMTIPVTQIPEFVDPARYCFDPRQKRPLVTYMTRKDRSGEWLRGVLTRRGEPFSAFAWTALRNMDEATYARHLREAAVYLPTTVQEGMHVSVLEAMACGCLVVGYAGVGGETYMMGDGAEQNCILVPNGDLLALGQTLADVLCHLHADPQHYTAIRERGMATARRYQDAAAEAQALQAFFGQF